MTSEEIETRIAEGRQALQQAGNPGTFLIDDEVQGLRGVIDELPDSDMLVPLLPSFAELTGSSYYQVRRVSAYVLYGQVEAALAEEDLAQRAQRFADDLHALRGTYLPNELVELYNAFIDEARAAGLESPFLGGDTTADARDSGYSGTPGVYAEATLEAIAEGLRPPDEESGDEEGDESGESGSTDESDEPAEEPATE